MKLIDSILYKCETALKILEQQKKDADDFFNKVNQHNQHNETIQNKMFSDRSNND